MPRSDVIDPALLHDRLDDARARTDEIFAAVEPATLYERPIPERHRLIFYLGHVEAFDWNLWAVPLELPRFDEALDRLFAFGIDPVDGGLPSEPPSAWPRHEVVAGYARRVRERLDAALRDAPPPADPRLIETALEHRLMHAETLAYLLHQLPPGRKQAPAGSAVHAGDTRVDAAPAAVSPPRITIPRGTATLGRRRDAPGFGWDNEFGQIAVEVPEFAIDVLPVTNGRFLEFVRDGGYREARFWGEEDWAWRARESRRHPQFWIDDGEGFRWRGMFAEMPLPLDHPVYVSLAEARAFARWAGGELPEEAQFHRAAYGTAAGIEREYPWGDEAPGAEHGNVDFHDWDPVPASRHPAGTSAFGVADLVGNGWEWTRTPFAPFPGFTPFPFYRGYSADFFDGQHFVLKGGSPRTAAVMLRRSFRNWFQPHYPYVYAKFRLVQP